MPPGIRQKANYYLEGIRKNYIMCAERVAMAKFYKLSANDYKMHGAKDRIHFLSARLTEVGKHSHELRDSYMLATVVPCQHCKPAIIASRPRGVLVDTNSGKHFKRSDDFMETVSSFAANGITLYKLAV